jgi:hypothetical protein
LSQRFYLCIRDLHLYFGLFTSPFVLLFSISVFFLNHAWLPGVSSEVVKRTIADIQIPKGLERLQGMKQVEQAKKVLSQVGVTGEIGFVRHAPKESRLVIPVMKPGRETTIELDLKRRSATIQQRDTGLWDALVYLHKSPGQHNANIRGNWFYTRAWTWLADGAVYLLLFISVSGIYLWAVLRSERKIGLVLLGAGAASFFGVVYALTA